MAGYVAWRLEMDVADGRMDELVALMEEMVASTHAEPGTLIYEWSFAEDGRVCHLSERYADSEAALAHLATFGRRFAQRFFDLLQPQRVVLYGTPSEALRAALADVRPLVLTQRAGFSRL